MMTNALREQMAAILINGEDDTQAPQLQIHGGPGTWSVVLTASESEPQIGLAAVRTPSVLRIFKTLDAAFSAAVDIARLADPQREAAFYKVPVVILNSACAVV